MAMFRFASSIIKQPADPELAARRLCRRVDRPGHGGGSARSRLSADWYWPTLGESGTHAPSDVVGSRRKQLREKREAAESACRNALESRPELRRRFDVLLQIAQR